jgi:sulfide dehydrogenase cytochrome subunit
MAVAAASIATPSAAQPTTQLLADSCASCHGTDGNSPGSIDKLNDIKRAKFLEEMTEFKYKQGKGRIMGPIARGLSDAQIKALADHFQAFNR